MNKLGQFKIGKRMVGAGQPVFIVMEVAQAHDGSLGTAHAFIDVAAEAGVDAVKFQTHIAEAETTLREPFRVKFSRQDKTRYDYWKRMEFSPEQWRGLRDHAHEKNLVFLSTPFSVAAVDLLEDLGMPAWKVGSGDITNTPLLDRLVATGRPVMISSGMSTMDELDRVVKRLKKAGNGVMLYQCTTQYPCPPERVGLPMLVTLRERYGISVGLSDHSGEPHFGIAAAALGAASVEVHCALSRRAFGPDVVASLTPDELTHMVQGIRHVERSMATAPDKNQLAKELAENRRIFGRSIVAARNLTKGTVLTEKDLAYKKPGGGLGPDEKRRVLGKRLKRAVQRDDLLEVADVK